ncbi:MAG TPA: TIGR00730 family Rossman fold protein [Stellaceae bacterium]|nr:TIGR00730 family Rossman fold protein [Stellaceae bacterium]
MTAKRLCVFCGSSLPAEQAFQDAAATLGDAIGRSGIDLVYGGGRVGLMGILADAALAAGAKVFGVIPTALHGREVGHIGLTDLVVVPDMQERKRQMFALSDAVAVLPGGLGTLDEAFEAITLRQLRFFDKPIVLVDIAGYWQPLIALVRQVIAAGFAAPRAERLYQVVTRTEDVIPACFGDSSKKM